MFVVGGESLMDVEVVPAGPGHMAHMIAHRGGSPYNCAMALSKLGNPSGFLCPISKDPFGGYLLEALDEAGVTTLLRDQRVEAQTTLAVVTKDAEGKAQYNFHRRADKAFTPAGLIAALPDKPALFQVGGFCMIEAKDTAAWLQVAREAARRGAVISTDPNVRPLLIDDYGTYWRQVESVLDIAQLVKFSHEDLMTVEKRQATKKLPPAEEEAIITTSVASFFACPNVELVVVTLAERGSRAYTRNGARAEHGIHLVPIPPGQTEKDRDTIGAGDTLMAGILSWLAEQGHLGVGKLGVLDAAALGKMLQFGAVAAGLNCAHLGCHPPTLAEVRAVLSA